MKMAIDKVQRETFRLRLQTPPEYLAALSQRPDIVNAVANGVGSETSWTYHITPDTVWGLNINPTSHIHDWMYTFPLYFPSVAAGLTWKLHADHWFDINGHIQVADGICLLRPFRRRRINTYTIILSAGGTEAFWEHKPLPPDWNQYYTARPACDMATVRKFMEIESIMNHFYPDYHPYQLPA